jgi:hypothetical protein
VVDKEEGEGGVVTLCAGILELFVDKYIDNCPADFRLGQMRFSPDQVRFA